MCVPLQVETADSVMSIKLGWVDVSAQSRAGPTQPVASPAQTTVSPAQTIASSAQTVASQSQTKESPARPGASPAETTVRSAQPANIGMKDADMRLLCQKLEGQLQPPPQIRHTHPFAKVLGKSAVFQVTCTSLLPTSQPGLPAGSCCHAIAHSWKLSSCCTALRRHFFVCFASVDWKRSQLCLWQGAMDRLKGC